MYCIHGKTSDYLNPRGTEPGARGGRREGTTTTFRIAPDRITLRREGTLNSEMIFQEGQKHVSLYETPYGGLILGVNTHRAKADLGTAGGRLSIRYALEVDSQPIGENSFEIQVTEPHLTAPAPGQ